MGAEAPKPPAFFGLAALKSFLVLFACAEVIFPTAFDITFIRGTFSKHSYDGRRSFVVGLACPSVCARLANAVLGMAALPVLSNDDEEWGTAI
eukprot:6196039-Pleurochrysis_carterae.AAC.6